MTYLGVTQTVTQGTVILLLIDAYFPGTNICSPFVVGLGEPAYFYVESIFLLNGIMMGVFFLFGTYLRYAYSKPYFKVFDTFVYDSLYCFFIVTHSLFIINVHS